MSAASYILGTDQEELHRLGFQHRVWSRAAYDLWERAGFSRGQSILDLGCGPGYDAIDLANIVGPEGKVIAIDKSPEFIDYLQGMSEHQSLVQVETQCTDFMHMQLQPGSLDGAYSRWVLCWVADPDLMVKNVVVALKPGGTFAAQEYVNWGSFRVWPRSEAHERVVQACLESWRQSEGQINIGGELPRLFERNGLHISHIAPLSRTGQPGSMPWQWVTTFLDSYMPRLISRGLLREEDHEVWKQDQHQLEQNPAAFCFCPEMIEVIGVRA